MMDILNIPDGEDMTMLDTQLKKAENILSIQVGALEYIPDFGIDLKYFLDEKYSFQNESFKAYLVERLAVYSVNVSNLTDLVESLSRTYIFNIDKDKSGSGGLVSK